LADLRFLCQEDLRIINIKDNNEKHIDDSEDLSRTIYGI